MFTRQMSSKLKQQRTDVIDIVHENSSWRYLQNATYVLLLILLNNNEILWLLYFVTDKRKIKREYFFSLLSFLNTTGFLAIFVHHVKVLS